MNDIVFRTDLRRFKPALGELYVVMRMPKGELPRLNLVYYVRKGRMVRRRDLAVILDFVASDFRTDRPGMDFTLYVEQDPDILGIQEASDNAILMFARLWKDGVDDFLMNLQTWLKKEKLKQSEKDRLQNIACVESDRQLLYGQRR